MPQKELNLFQLSSRSVAEASTGAAQVVRRQFLQSNPSRRIFHDVPDGFLGHAFTEEPPFYLKLVAAPNSTSRRTRRWRVHIRVGRRHWLGCLTQLFLRIRDLANGF